MLVSYSLLLSLLSAFVQVTPKSPALPFPPHLLLSENHARFLHSHALPRRLRNVVIVLEWTPPAAAPAGPPPASDALTVDGPTDSTRIVLLSLSEVRNACTSFLVLRSVVRHSIWPGNMWQFICCQFRLLRPFSKYRSPSAQFTCV